MSRKALNAVEPSSKFENAEAEVISQKKNDGIYIVTDSLTKYYEIKGNLGSGHFGKVKLGISRLGNKQKVAIKSLLKSRIEDFQSLKRELMILKTADHPNIIKLYEVFEDEKYIHIIMELCTGGELFNRIEKKKTFSEKEASVIMYKMFYAINHLHTLNIAHRDLKPENCLYETKHDDSELKLVDFGLASKFSPEAGMSSVVGTPLYVAPEIINGSYGPECDVWSLGVILHTLLVGYAPFRGENRNEIFKKVMRGKFSLKEKEFQTVSAEAKNLIKKLLNPNTSLRIKAAEAMDDQWFRINLAEYIERPINGDTLRTMMEFKVEGRLKTEILKTIARFLNEKDKFVAKENFRLLDVNHSGFISAKELESGFKKAISDVPSEKIKGKHYEDIVKQVDYEEFGVISYTEFVIATTDPKILSNESNVVAAFKHFDIVKYIQDNNQFISKENLKKKIEKTGAEVTGAEIDKIMRDASLNSLEKIEFKEFCQVIDRNFKIALSSYDLPLLKNFEEAKDSRKPRNHRTTN